MFIKIPLAVTAALALSACASSMSAPAMVFSQAGLPATVQVPAGHKGAMETVGVGAMQGVTYIQRVKTQGGVAPAMACDAANMGSQQIVNYQADYIFWKAV
jgi:hypothetical protein